MVSNSDQIPKLISSAMLWFAFCRSGFMHTHTHTNTPPLLLFLFLLKHRAKFEVINHWKVDSPSRNSVCAPVSACMHNKFCTPHVCYVKPHLWPVTFLLGKIIKIFIKMSLSSVNSFTFYLVLINISDLLCSKCCTVGWQSPEYSFFIPKVNSWSQIQRSSNIQREIKLLKQGQHENDPAEQTTEAEWRRFE